MHMMFCAFNNYNDIPIPIFPSYLLPQLYCINQADAEEKGIEVQKMDRICSQAFAVRAWLGPWKVTGNIVLGPLNNIISKYNV